MLLTDSLHLSRQGEKWVDMEIWVYVSACTRVHADRFPGWRCCPVLFGRNAPSLVIYVTVLARTLEGHPCVLPGGDNVPKQRPSQCVEELIVMGIVKLASW